MTGSGQTDDDTPGLLQATTSLCLCGQHGAGLRPGRVSLLLLITVSVSIDNLNDTLDNTNKDETNTEQITAFETFSLLPGSHPTTLLFSQIVDTYV